MQKHYLHCVPPQATNSRRVVLIFRKGREGNISADSGSPITGQVKDFEMYSRKVRKTIPQFGITPFNNYIKEGVSYDRRYLWHTSSHR